MNNFLTWELLGTFAGCLGATVVLTEYLKKIFPKIHAQIISYFIALVIICGVQVVSGAFEWKELLLDILNAVVVSMAANGGFDALKNAFGKSDGKGGSDGELIIDEREATNTAYMNFTTDPNGYKEGDTVTLKVKKMSQE